VQLLDEIIFPLTPDDRNGWIFGDPAAAVAGVANQQLGAKLGLSGFCRHRSRGQRGQNAEKGRKTIGDHVLHCHHSVPVTP
jgi:hypothetical protein